MLTMTAEAIARLRALGIATFHAPGFSLSEDCVFEPPCSIKWLQLPYTFRMGAFSYGVSGYFFACVLGRYVSVGEDVQIGRHGHPPEWASTSPLFYQWPSQVLDLEIEAAARVAPNDFMLGQSGQVVKTTHIGNDVWIGHGAFIAPGVVIGNGAVVGAQSVVTKDVPPYTIVAGVPAKVIRQRFSDEIVEKMLKARWWRYAFWDLKGASITDPLRFLDRVDQLMDENLAEYAPPLVVARDVVASVYASVTASLPSSGTGGAMP